MDALNEPAVDAATYPEPPAVKEDEIDQFRDVAYGRIIHDELLGGIYACEEEIVEINQQLIERGEPALNYKMLDRATLAGRSGYALEKLKSDLTSYVRACRRKVWKIRQEDADAELEDQRAAETPVQAQIRELQARVGQSRTTWRRRPRGPLRVRKEGGR